MANFGTLQAKIADKLDRDDLTTQIATAINSTIDYYSDRQFWFVQGQVDIVLIPYDPIITGLPADFLFEQPSSGLVIVDNGARYPLTKISPLKYDTINNQTTGLPFAYVSRNKQLELYYYPDDTYTLELNYQKFYPDLVNSADTNDFTNYAARLVEAKSLADLYADYRHDFEKFNFYQAIADDELKRLQSQTISKLATGTLSTDNIIDTRSYYYDYY